MGRYAKGKHAFGYCDRTGFRYPLKDLVEQIENRRPTGLRVGKDVVDKDHPQLQLGEVVATDPYPLKDPRPDLNTTESRALWAWDPVGGGVTGFGTRTVGLDMTGNVGRVTVETG